MKTNIDYLIMIKKNCEEILKLHERFGNSFSNYENDIAYRNTVRTQKGSFLLADKIHGHDVHGMVMKKL